MDTIDFDNVKAEKANALRRFQSIAFLFRIAEICAALLVLCWMFTSLPFALRISADFLRRISSVASTPLFMFVLGNSIVFALLKTNSTVFSARQTIDGVANVDTYDEFARSGENRVTSPIFFDDKQMIDDAEADANSNPTVAREDHMTTEPEKDSVTVTDLTKDHPPPPTKTKVYRRSKTEISAKQSPDSVSKPSLRRSETEKCRETVETIEEDQFPEDNLTNEEFQKTIEAFIAKQLIFRRRESLDVVIHNQI